MPETKPVETVTVTYTVHTKSKKTVVSFRAPKGTIFQGSDWKKNSSSDTNKPLVFNKKADEDINLGEISAEKNKLFTFIRYADGKPDLSEDDAKTLAKMYTLKLNSGNYMRQSAKQTYVKDHSINIEPHLENKASVTVLSERKLLHLFRESRYHMVSVELPDNGVVKTIDNKAK